MDRKIEEAKKFLEDNGYIVRKLTARQLHDYKICEECSANGEEIECFDCSCSVCIVQ